MVTIHLLIVGLCGEDLSNVDMSGLSPEMFKRLTFDTETKFPEDPKMQVKGINPQEIIEQGKFSNTLKELHKKGINGDGTTIVLIDNISNSQVSEFEGREVVNIVFKQNEDGTISYEEYQKYKEEEENKEKEKQEEDDDKFDNYHGKTTASLATGNKCGVAPETKVYLFGIAEGTDREKAQELILKYINENDIIPDIISMSADTKISEEAKTIINELKEQHGCAFLNSKEFWEDFLWGRISNDAKGVVLDELFKEVLNEAKDKKYDESTTPGRTITKACANVFGKESDMAVLPCKEVTCLENGKEGVYKYMGSFCGASFAIPQVAGLFLLARQIDKSISYDEFIEIVKNPEREKDGMMYVDFKETLKEIYERKKEREERGGPDSDNSSNISEDSVKVIANTDNVAKEKENAQDVFDELEKGLEVNRDNEQAINKE